MNTRTLAVAAAFVVASSGGASLQKSQGGPYRLVQGWGALPNSGTWGEVPGMAIDAAGRIYAFHRSEPPIVELDRDGKILKMWGEKLFAWPHGIRIDRFGTLWITDGQARNGIGQQVFKYSPDGKLLMTLGTKGKRGDGPGEFNLPHTIVIDSRGRVLVGDRSNNRIQIFDQDGAFIDQWTQFGTPSGMYVAPDDTLYVVDYNVKKG